MRNHVVIATVAAVFGVATFATEAEAASSISWSIAEAECSVDHSVTVRIANERLAALPAGTASLGLFKGSYAQIPAGGVRDVVLTADTGYWRCNNVALTLALKTSTTTYSIPGGRSTIDYSVFFPAIDDDPFFEWEATPMIQYFECNESDPWLSFYAEVNGFLQGDEDANVYLEGPILGFMHTEIETDGRYYNLDFHLASGCPHVDTPVHLFIEGDDYHESNGTLRPVTERAKGSKAY